MKWDERALQLRGFRQGDAGGRMHIAADEFSNGNDAGRTHIAALEFRNGDEAARTHMSAWGFDINVWPISSRKGHE